MRKFTFLRDVFLYSYRMSKQSENNGKSLLCERNIIPDLSKRILKSDQVQKINIPNLVLACN
jgi:hypothetical protein